jgi:hypothetical protein
LEQITEVEIPCAGHYDVSVSFSYPLPDVHPKYIGDCPGTIKPGDHLSCVIDPYGHAVSTGTRHTATSMTPSAIESCPDKHDIDETAFLWHHTYGHPGTAGLPHPIQWSRFVEHTPDDDDAASNVKSKGNKLLWEIWLRNGETRDIYSKIFSDPNDYKAGVEKPQNPFKIHIPEE